MPDKFQFQALNPKQKITKIAQSIRIANQKLQQYEKPDFKTLGFYFNCILEEKNEKIKKACKILENLFLELDKKLPGQWIKLLNFAFHDLMEIIEPPLHEDFYEPLFLFDRNEDERPVKKMEVSAILDNLRSPFNAGSIFRSADCLGVKELLLCGITPHPPEAKIVRTAMGTSEKVSWKYFSQTIEAVQFQRNQGFKIAAAETTKNAVPISNFGDFAKTAFIFGNEEFGITEDILAVCDISVSIPMRGFKNSMNVSNAFAIVMYEAGRKLF